MHSIGAKKVKPVIDELRAQGWKVDPTERGHWKAIPPDKTKEIVHFSLSIDQRAFFNTIKLLEAQGFLWPPKSKNDAALERRENATELDDNEERAFKAAVKDAGLQYQPPESRLTLEDMTPEERSAHERLMKAANAIGVCPVTDEPHQAYDAPTHHLLNGAVVAGTTSTPARSEDEPEKLDRAYDALKEAKLYYSLAEVHDSECAVLFLVAQKKLEEARAELLHASQVLSEKKRAFDAAFTASRTTA